jgi:ornithine cyclodeaminase/alanine dehydrogenase-like protein (mu-crystallin family)
MSTLVLTRSDVTSLLTLTDCIAAVERAFHAHVDGRTLGPGVLGVHAHDGGFHIKAAGLLGEQSYFAAKTNANFPENPKRFGLPVIQGTVVLSDASNGGLLAVLESGSITALRTGAATGVAARHLARPDARSATIVGCGVQGRTQLEALVAVLPLERVRLVDVDGGRATALARHAEEVLKLRVEIVADVHAALRASEVCVTCTPARRAFVALEDIEPGTFLAAVGADNPEKQEVDPALLARSTLVVDVLDQCAEIGELHHALASGAMTRAQVHAELGDVVAGRRPGRTRPDEITIFDSSGTALQDVAAAVAVYERARAAGRGVKVEFDD